MTRSWVLCKIFCGLDTELGLPFGGFPSAGFVAVFDCWMQTLFFPVSPARAIPGLFFFSQGQ